ncbi:unnamed protein product [Anisakis simplex]|uniref:Superoxide dismutase [Cu-Zn] n=1 Tax=Anisakis simplex TaxID=6269 RepID=A0A0M3K6L1_ANISI|nr:unnamed protein product [Anisakis simplex]
MLIFVSTLSLAVEHINADGFFIYNFYSTVTFGEEDHHKAYKFAAVKARVCVLKANKDDEYRYEKIGVLDMKQVGGTVEIKGTLQGLSPGLHGFHVHEKGDIGNGCVAAGGHFNPSNKTHGAPDDIERHVGDLGNIEANEAGVANVSIEDSVISLRGPYSVIGRAIVVHEKADDLGRGNTPASKTTGDAGARVACGIIGTD